MDNAGIEIVIMTRNRPKMLSEAMGAIDKLKFEGKVKKWVSDNSVDSNTHPVIPLKWQYKARGGGLSIFSHVNQIISELTMEWALITHDDDVILQELAKLYNNHYFSKSISAISGLSKIIGPDKLPKQDLGYLKRLDSCQISQKILYPAEQILCRQLFGGSIFPMSACVIRTEVLKTLFPIDESMSHAGDFYIGLMICNVKKYPYVVFEGTKPVMEYHLHGDNDSGLKSMKTRMHAESLITIFQVIAKRPELWKVRFSPRIIFYILRANYYANKDEELKTLENLKNEISKIEFFPLKYKFLKKLLVLNARWYFWIIPFSKVYNVLYWKLKALQFSKKL